MVTIISYAKRTSENGKEFFALILQGGIFMVQSKKTGQFYATAKKTSISSTLDELSCKNLLGTTLEGEIEKVKSDPYSYRIETTGETITLNYKWQFAPPVNVEAEVFDGPFTSFENFEREGS